MLINFALFSQTSPKIEWKKVYESKKNEVAYDIAELPNHNFAIIGARVSAFGNTLELALADLNGNKLNSAKPKMVYTILNPKLNIDKKGNIYTCGITNTEDEGSAVRLIKSNQELNFNLEKNFSTDINNFGGIAIPTADGGIALAYNTSPSDDRTFISTSLVKLGYAGKSKWNKKFPGDSIFMTTDIIEADDGGFVLIGTYSEIGMIGTAFIMKVDKYGNKQWLNKIQTNGGCELKSIAKCKDGYVIAGNFYNMSLNKDIWISKYSKKGVKIWEKTIGGYRADECYKIIADNDGGFVIAGATKSKGLGGWDAYIVKTDNGGNVLWEKTAGGVFDDKAYGITKTFDGGYVFAGYTQVTRKKQMWIVKLQISIREQAQAYVQSKIKEWQKKGKYEKMADYQVRVNENTRKQKIYELSNEFFGKIGNSIFEKDIKTATLDYDTESEIFRINLDYFNPLYIPVPIDEAPDFEKNFSKMQFSDIVFRLTKDDKLEIAQMTIKDPIKNKYYFFDATVPVVFNNETIVTDFEPIVIPSDNTEDNSSTTSDVDTDIPKIGKTYPNRFALIIGNAHYIEKGSDMVDIHYSINDAKIFREYAVNVLGIPNDNNHIYYIEDANATFMRLYIDNFAKLIQSQPAGSEFYIFYSGHGTQNDKKEAFMVPVGVTSDYIDQFGIKLSDFYKQITPDDSKKVYVFLDACFSGGGKSGQLLVNAKTGMRQRPNNSQVGKNLVVFAAASENQIAQEYLEKHHGLFTYYLLKNLKETKGQITYGQLADRILNDINTTVLNPKNKFKQQTPVVNVNPQIQNTWKNWKINN